MRHSALDPFGVQAAQITELWWVYAGVCVAVYLVTLGFLLFALWRSRRGGEAQPDAEELARRNRRAAPFVLGGVALTVATLLALLVQDFLVGRAIARGGAERAAAVRIEVIGHQWWWELRYDDPLPSRRFTTANELHVPVGHAVELTLSSHDVIHSFWAPSLHGKMDLIPGYRRAMTIEVSEPGRYLGQCAEFCGHQHANMKLIVHAVSPQDFERWRARQAEPARSPQTAAQLRGQQVFLGSSCIMCHAIDGTVAAGQVAPNLTHLASRTTIAAGMLPNTRGHLGGWIVNPQALKPGVNMPANVLPPGDLHALLEYLQSLR